MFRPHCYLILFSCLLWDNIPIFNSFSCYCMVFPSLFLEDNSYFKFLALLSQYKCLSLYLKLYFGDLNSISLVFVFIFIPIPHCSDYYHFVVCYKIRNVTPLIFFLMTALILYSLLWFHINIYSNFLRIALEILEWFFEMLWVGCC